MVAEMPHGGGGQPLHFELPPGLERFSYFKDLPYDLRYKIWQEAIYTPGIHFLKYERNHVSRISIDQEPFDNGEDSLLEQQSVRSSESGKVISNTRRKRYTATLAPIFPLPAA
ncbi:hypothetical protein, partial [Erythrobacter sp. YJ-T3-07]|uniref:hypothetical protein n=1 Tax=Erythrobacter sp. YJ-T3-07 TaxID=2793063 RepID=UPI001F2AE6EA